MNTLTSGVTRSLPRSASSRLADWFSRHWYAVVMSLLLLWTGLPVVAPLAMLAGWTGLGRAIYTVYSFQCHQLPERSFFLFGPKVMYSLSEIQAAWVKTDNPFVLRQFIGTPAMGWKVAWSDRMVAMYGGIPLFALLYYPFRRKIKPLPIWAFALLLLPVAVDGVTHTISDAVAVGLGAGFRDTNTWLAALTRYALPSWFYAGDAIGSFNSWMRIVTGILFALGLVWLAFPYMREAVGEPDGASARQG